MKSLDNRPVPYALEILIALWFLGIIVVSLDHMRHSLRALLAIAQEFTLSTPPTTGPVVRPPATEAAHDGEAERRAV